MKERRHVGAEDHLERLAAEPAGGARLGCLEDLLDAVAGRATYCI